MYLELGIGKTISCVVDCYMMLFTLLIALVILPVGVAFTDSTTTCGITCQDTRPGS